MRAVVYYNYPASGVGEKLARLDNIAANGSPGDSDKFAAYTYLRAGTVVKVAHPGVTNGLNLDYTEALLCVWDAWNRLAKVYKDNGTGTGNAGTLMITPPEGGNADTLLAQYQYDGRGYRVVKLVPAGENWDRTDYYYNEGWQTLEVRKDSDADPYEQYVWDVRYIDAPVCRFRDGSQSCGYGGRVHYAVLRREQEVGNT